MSEQELRQLALEKAVLALRGQRPSPDKVLRTANRFYQYMVIGDE